MDDVEDSEELDGCVEKEKYGGCLVKVREVIVIEDDDQEECEMSEEHEIYIKQRLRNVLDWLHISLRRLREHLAETGKVIQEAVVSPAAIAIMKNSTSINLILYNCLISCSRNDVPVVVEWLYDFLEERIESGHDDLTLIEQDCLRAMLDYVHEMVMMELRANDEEVEWIHSSNNKISMADTDNSE